MEFTRCSLCVCMVNINQSIIKIALLLALIKNPSVRVLKLTVIVNLYGVSTKLYFNLLDVVFRSFLIFYYIVCFYRSQRRMLFR